jgi:hypothetical protein
LLKTLAAFRLAKLSTLLLAFIRPVQPHINR